MKVENHLMNSIYTSQFQNEIWKSRLGYFALFVYCYLHYHQIDAWFQQVWISVRQTWWFRHDTCEPVTAFLSFALWIHCFSCIDRFAPDWFTLKYVIAQKSRKVELQPGVASKAGLVYLGVFIFYDSIYPRRYIPMDGPGTLWMVMFQIVFAIWLYDLFFFPIHYCFHHVRKLAKFHHRHHETVTGMYSTEVLRHSIVDGSMQVGCNICVLKVLQLHPFSRFLYNIIITYMLTEIHSGYDFPWMIHNVIPCGVLGGSKRHEYHHRYGKRYYQQFFTYIDDYLIRNGCTLLF